MKGVLSVLFVVIIASFLGQSFKNHPSRLVSNYSESSEFNDIGLLLLSENRFSVDLPEELTEYELYTLDISQTDQLRSSAPMGFNLPLTLAGSSMDLHLIKVDISAGGFIIVEQPSGIPHDIDIGLHYRGVVDGIEGSIVAISILDNEISGLISIPGVNENIVLGKIKNSSEHILYSDGQIKDEFEFSCLTEPFDLEKIQFPIVPKNLTSKCPEIFIDIGNEIFIDKGSIDNAVSYVAGLFNQVALLYAADNVNILLHGLNVWSTPEDFVTLGQYRAYRQSNPVGGDFKAYLNYSFDGGVAYTVGVCGSFIYSISGIESDFNNVPTYSWSVLVIAHELGHNMGSPHTHSCSWNSDNSAIDGCGFEAGYSEGCDGEIPLEGGTIMSYCHLSEVGINFSNGFGLQPAQLIRGNLDDSPCIDTCSVGPSCYDGIQNGGETGIDCGGPDCEDCPEDCPVSIIFLPIASENGPAMIICNPEVIPFNYSVALNQECAQEILESNSQCLEDSWGIECQEAYSECIAIVEADCSVFETAPVDLSKSYDTVDGVEDRVQVKFYKSSPQIAYAPKDMAACDILFWKKRFLNPETGQVVGLEIQSPDSTLLSKVRSSSYRPFFKWPIKYWAEGENNSNRVEPNLRYEWKVRCYCQDGEGLVSPWSSIRQFNTPNFDISTGQNGPMNSVSQNIESKDLVPEDQLNIYPNPTEGLLNISFESSKGEKNIIQVLNMLGKVEKTETLIGSGDLTNIKLDLSGLSAGNYVLQIYGEHRSLTERITLSR